MLDWDTQAVEILLLPVGMMNYDTLIANWFPLAS